MNFEEFQKKDRFGREELLAFVPALSLKQLTYAPERDLVRYRPAKGRPDSPAVLEWSGAEFVERMAALIPPARKHLVRYYGALGPRSPLRRAVSMAARGKATAAELEAGYVIMSQGESSVVEWRLSNFILQLAKDSLSFFPGQKWNLFSPESSLGSRIP